MIAHKQNPQSGVALIMAMIFLVLISSLTFGFYLTVRNGQISGHRDMTKTQAFYAAHAGVEKLTADLGTFFASNYAPTGTQINNLTNSPPTISNVSYTNPLGGSGYQISFPTNGQGNPLATNRTILSGTYQGFVGLIVPYTITGTAVTSDGSEVRLQRTLQTVSIPVFQFGIFSESDLNFFAGPNFNFGGRVHTNGNLYLASGNGNTLTLSDRNTAVGEVIRTNLSNGWPTSSNYTGTVNVLRSTGVYRALASNEGSLTGTIGSAQNEPTWTNLSISTYNGYIRSGRTGAKRLDLPLVSLGATAIDLIRRPATNEDTNNPNVFSQRYYSMASLRILLSDTSARITSLPTVSGTAPLLLGNLTTSPIAGYTVDATHPPFAVAGAAAPYLFPAGTPLLDGYLKIEMQTNAGAWQDVTLEILNLGIAGRNLSNGGCTTDPSSNAVLRFQRVKDAPATSAPCGVGSTQATDYWPNVLYDTREGIYRDNLGTGSATIYLGGAMHYIELDMNNLNRWFTGAIGTSGTSALNTTGYVVYFSDRRNNSDASGNETGEYGFEDVVNFTGGTGAPNGNLDAAEDVNGNGVLDTYGQSPVFPASGAGSAPLNAAARPWTTTTTSSNVRANRAIFFRRALKLVNGSLGNLPSPGVTVVSENPVYIQGNFNASSAAGFGDPHVASAVIADAVTLLSGNWNDINSFSSPNDPGGRNGTTTWYRLAIIAGKGLSFPNAAGTIYQDFGTDGGAHNFLRYIENWGGDTLNYRGSLISFYHSRQAVGTYKCCVNVYSPPTRGYNFDTEFLQPSLLPPRTPMFRDVNVTGFTQLVLPTQ